MQLWLQILKQFCLYLLFCCTWIKATSHQSLRGSSQDVSITFLSPECFYEERSFAIKKCSFFHLHGLGLAFLFLFLSDSVSVLVHGMYPLNSLYLHKRREGNAGIRVYIHVPRGGLEHAIPIFERDYLVRQL